MLCCIGEIACFVFGILSLVRGRFSLTASRVVEGGGARAIGVLLLLPLLLGQGGGAIYAAFWAAKHAGQADAMDIQKMQQELTTPALIINIVGSAVPLVAAFIVALVTAKPVERKRRPLPEDEEEDFDDTYRRPRDYGEGEPGPRRQPDENP